MVSLREAILCLYPNAVAIQYVSEDIPPVGDYLISDAGKGPFISHWNPELGKQPTEQELAAVTQEQIDNARLMKLRTKAKEALADQAESQNALVRAVVLELLDYANEQRKRHNQLLQWIGGQTTLLNRGQLAALALNEATPQQAKQAIVSRIENREAD